LRVFGGSRVFTILGGRVTKRNKIIEDKKLRGEWAESVFMERATQHGLPVSKPWGEMCPYDFVIGKTGRFVSVQVKSTTAQFENGFVCTVRGGHKAYPPGSFDFLAAYAVPDDAWYIIPLELIRGKRSITLFPKSKTAKYEPYREAWHLLREASAVDEAAIGEAAIDEATGDEATSEAEPSGGASAEVRPGAIHPAGMVERMGAVENYVRRWLEGGAVRGGKAEDER
jgi:hypothetical protein